MTKSKMMATGGAAMKSKMGASGGMTKKGYAAGGVTMAMPMKKGYAAGGMPMVKKDGMNVPAFAADGKGKMAKGGAVKAPMTKKK
jgi:hypothetical protein